MLLLIMIDDNSSGNLEVKEVLNLETLSTDASINRSHDFLLKHVRTSLSLIIMYVDLFLDWDDGYHVSNVGTFVAYLW